MLKKFIATALLVVFLHAQNEKFQVIATDVKTKENNVLVATGNVVIFSPTYYITAQKIIYDKENETFELFDDVMIVKNNNVQTKSDYAFLDIKTDGIYQKPTMYYDSETLVWMSSKESEKKNNKIFIEDSIISSCDCVDPDWSIRSSSADFNTEDKWFNIYNPRIYIKDIPVLYSPYLGFSTDRSRRTGLLMPSFGLSSAEGFSYIQPIFLAPEKNYDFEFIPQFRANRGKGLYTYFNYADSPDSILSLSGGYFNELDSFQEEYGIRNKTHFGFDVNYERYNLFTAKRIDNKDGLYVDINYLNDVEYKTLEDDRYKDDIESKIESKINYIYDTPKYFLGSYFRYYIDTKETSNDETLQELPKLQAHSYSSPIILDNLLYSSDIKYTNHYRKTGVNADQLELNLPFSYSLPLLDDYLRFQVKHTFSINKFNYSNADVNFKDGTYGEANTTFSLNTDLTKPYDNFIHSVNLFTDYTKVNKFIEEGDLRGVTIVKIDNPLTQEEVYNNLKYDNLRAFPISKTEDNITFGLNQSFYDKESTKEIVNHKLKQSVLFDDFNDAKLQNMQNEIIYNYLLGTIKSRLVYNHQDKKLVESSSAFSLTYDNFYMKLGHYLSKETENSGFENLESFQFTSKYKLSSRYSAGYFIEYDLQKDIRNEQSFSFSINDSCWKLDLKYANEITATSTTNPIEQDLLYIQLMLKPMGAVNEEIEINRNN